MVVNNKSFSLANMVGRFVPYGLFPFGDWITIIVYSTRLLNLEDMKIK